MTTQNTQIIELKSQIIVDGELASKLTVTPRKITFKAMAALEAKVMVRDPLNPKIVHWRDKSDSEFGIAAVSYFCGLTEKEAGEIDLSDLKDVMGAISPFLEVFQEKTPKTE